MNVVKRKPLLSVDDYLAGERVSDVRHEYAAGQVFAMAGGSKRHNRISLKLASLLQASAGPCITHMADVLVRIDQVFYYPDLMVVCEPNSDAYVETNPCLIVEVLSDSTEAIDRREKLYNYQRIAHLQAYVLVAQNERRVDVFRRAGKVWTFETHTGDNEITLDCPALSFTLDQLYSGMDVPAIFEAVSAPPISS